MFHTCVRKLDVTGTVEKIWELNAASTKLLDCTSYLFFTYTRIGSLAPNKVNLERERLCWVWLVGRVCDSISSHASCARLRKNYAASRQDHCSAWIVDLYPVLRNCADEIALWYCAVWAICLPGKGSCRDREVHCYILFVLAHGEEFCAASGPDSSFYPQVWRAPGYIKKKKNMMFHSARQNSA